MNGSLCRRSGNIDLKLIAKRGFKFLLILLVTAILGVAGIALRVLYAPIDLPYASTLISDEVSKLAPSLEISFDTAEFGWDWGTVRPWTRITDIRVRDIYGRMDGFIPEARVSLSREALLGGKFGIREIDLVRPVINIMDIDGYRAPQDPDNSNLFDGSEQLVEDPTKPAVVATRSDPSMLKPLVRVASRFGRRLSLPGTELNAITIQSGYVSVSIPDSAEKAEILIASARLFRGDNTLVGEAIVDGSLGNRPVTVRLNGELEPFTRQVALSLDIQNIEPNQLQAAFSLPEAVNDLKASIDIVSDIEVTAQQGLTRADISINSSEAVLSHPGRFPTPARISTLNGRVLYDPLSKTMQISTLSLALPASKIDITGSLSWLSGGEFPMIDLVAALDQASLVDILKYWPDLKHMDAPGKRGTRGWVEDNIRAVKASNAVFELKIDTDGLGAFSEGSPYRLSFDFSDTVSGYYKNLPDITEASGSARLTNNSFSLDVGSGRIGDVTLDGSNVQLSNLQDRARSRGTFTVEVDGPIAQVLEILDHEPLKLLSKANIAPSQFEGMALGTAVIGMPLGADTAAGDIHMSASADVSKLSVVDLIPNIAITDGDVKARVTQDSLDVFGIALLGENPMSFEYHQPLGRSGSGANTPGLVRAEGLVGPDTLSLFGADISDFVEGDMIADVTLRIEAGGVSGGDFTADATDIKLMVPQLLWAKPTGSPATVSGSLEFMDNAVSVSPLTVQGSDIDLSAVLDWNELDRDQGAILRGTIEANRLGLNELTADLLIDASQPTQINVKARQIDLAPFLSVSDERDRSNVASDPETESVDFYLNLAADKAMFLNAQYISDLTLQSAFEEGQPVSATLTGVGKSGNPVSLIIEASESPEKNLAIAAPDGGSLLRASGLFAHIVGGDFTFNGSIKGWSETLEISGTAEMKDYLVTSSAKLGEGVSDGVISGIDEYVSEKDMAFKTLSLPFIYRLGLMDISKMRANGDSAGITMEGQLDNWKKELNMNGVLVPAYGINSFLGKIPLLGTLLTGGKGKGIFAVAYRVKGPMSNPEFKINPLSGLAPGIFRSIFEGRKGKIQNNERDQLDRDAAAEAIKDKETGKEQGE